MPNKKITYSLFLLAIIITQLALTQFVAIAKGTDGVLYDGIAKALLNGQGTIDQPGLRGHGSDIGAIVMPGYPALIALIYAVFGVHFEAFIIFQVLLGVAACFVFYRIAKDHFNPWIALGATLWVIGYIEIWRYNLQFLMDSLSAGMVIFLIYFLHRYFRSLKTKHLCFFALLAGILIAINNRFIMHIGLVGLYLGYLSLKNTQIQFSKLLVVAGIIVLILLPWHIRQYLEYDQLMLFSPTRTEQAQGGKEREEGQFPTYEKQYERLASGNAAFGSPDNYLHLFTPEKYEAMKENYNAFDGFRKYWSRTKGFFEIIRTDFRFGFGGDTRITPPNIHGKMVVLHTVFNVLFLGSMFLLMLPGIFFAFKKNQPFFISLVILLAAHVILHSVVHLDPWLRYRIPIVPVIFMLGWYGVQNLVRSVPLLACKNMMHKLTERNR